MNRENSKILTEKYPYLYRRAVELGYSFAFECGDGWFDIINELSAKLEEMIVPFMEDFDIDNESVPCAEQVKEKWGILCFYMSTSTDEMDDAICDAEVKSAYTCEVCGKPATHYPHGWAKTRCDECLQSH